jgi:glucose/arabinose dehydrogenase
MMRRLAFASIVSMIALAACGSTSSEPTTEPVVDVDPSVLEPVSTEPPNVLPGDTVPADPVLPFIDVTLGDAVSGWSEPVDMASWADRETHVVERNGSVRRMNDDGTPGEVLLDVSELTRAEGERGLLGLAYSPDGSRAFVNHTDLEGDTVVARYDVRPDGTFDTSSRLEVLRIEQPYPNHNGGDLVMTDDGLDLLVFTGDGGSGGDPDRYSLDPDSLLGKVVRLDATSDAPAPEIWAVGLRNPWRVSTDPWTGDLWIADVGQGEWEEVNLVDLGDLRGSSFGWSAYEASHAFNDDQIDRHRQYREVLPVFEYEHVNGDCSISGGSVVRDESVESSGDWYVFSDFCSGVVRALCVEPGGLDTCGLLALGTVPTSVAVVTDHRNRVWVMSLDGVLVPLVAG